jgi:hypothetical protein
LIFNFQQALCFEADYMRIKGFVNVAVGGFGIISAGDAVSFQRAPVFPLARAALF